jgi:serine/threonine-protein kinase
MEIIEGMDLRKLLHLHGRFSVTEMLELMEPVCGAVHAAHEAGIVHRDLKASNVLVAEKDGKRVIKLLDFGIAKMLHGESAGQGLTEPGAMVGTAHNMAPEQIRCERVDARTDVYALGVLIFQLLTGRYPFEAADAMQISMLHLQAPPPRPSSLAPVPPAIDAIVLRCLEKLPSRRFRSVSDLVTSLSEAIGQARKAPLDSSSEAIGAYFAVVVSDEDEMDDAMMEDMSMVLDTAEQRLGGSGFVFPLKTSMSLLGVRLLDPEADGDGERTEVEAAVDALLAELEERPTRHPDVRVEAYVSVGEAVCRSTESGVEVVGGPLLEVGTWTNHGK